MAWWDLPRGAWKPALALGSVFCAVILWRAYPFLNTLPVPTQRERVVAERMDLFEHLDVIEDLSLLQWISEGEAADEETG